MLNPHFRLVPGVLIPRGASVKAGTKQPPGLATPPAKCSLPPEGYFTPAKEQQVFC